MRKVPRHPWIWFNRRETTKKWVKHLKADQGSLFFSSVSPRQQTLAVYSQSSQVFCSDAFSDMEDHWPAFWALKRYFFVQPDVKVTSHNIFPKFISKISSNLPQFLLIAYYRGWYDQIAQFTNNCNVLAHHPLACFISFAFLGLFEELLYTCRWLYAIHYIPQHQCIFETSHKIRINSLKHLH
jgi:hypothetical protein